MVAHSARTKKSTLAPDAMLPEVTATEQAENLSLRRLSVDYLVHAGSANAQRGTANSAKYCQTLPTLGSKTANKATLSRKTSTSGRKRATSSSKSQTSGNNRKLWTVKCDSHQTSVELYRKDAQHVHDGPEKLQSAGNPP